MDYHGFLSIPCPSIPSIFLKLVYALLSFHELSGSEHHIQGCQKEPSPLTTRLSKRTVPIDTPADILVQAVKKRPVKCL